MIGCCALKTSTNSSQGHQGLRLPPVQILPSCFVVITHRRNSPQHSQMWHWRRSGGSAGCFSKICLNEIKGKAKVLSFSPRQNSHWARQGLNRTPEELIWKQGSKAGIYLCTHTHKTPHSAWPGTELFIQKESKAATKKSFKGWRGRDISPHSPREQWEEELGVRAAEVSVNHRQSQPSLQDILNLSEISLCHKLNK